MLERCAGEGQEGGGRRYWYRGRADPGAADEKGGVGEEGVEALYYLQGDVPAQDVYEAG